MGDEVLVVTDLDGTFWDLDMRLHPETRRAVEELNRRAIPLLIATGRRLATARAGLVDADLWRPTLVLNGALGVDFAQVADGADHPDEAPVFHRASFPTDAAHAVIDAFDEFGHNPCSYGSDGRVHIGPDATTGPRHRADQMAEIGTCDPRDLADAGDALGFSVIGVALDGLDDLCVQLRQLGLLVDTFEDPMYGGWSIMAQPPGISKQAGIEAFIAHSGLETPKVVAIGDGGNDLQMLEAADLAVGVEGGAPEILDVADHHIAPPNQGGWAKVIDLLDHLD